MNPLLFWAIRASLLLLNVKDGPLAKALKTEIDELRAQLTPHLPPPPNGVEWTRADLEAKAAEITALNAQIRERHST